MTRQEYEAQLAHMERVVGVLTEGAVFAQLALQTLGGNSVERVFGRTSQELAETA